MSNIKPALILPILLAILFPILGYSVLHESAYLAVSTARLR
ncbi:MAG: hypothetical protein HFACDABA_02299 [Anaerolineales bacterium]|nr:hypothetical protein [Anaerolineales bacterium]